MLIKQIILTNFRQYKGVNNFVFSTDSEKNITVVIGDNTCGKTTLVQSFIWCLYGHADFKDKSILNAEEKDELLEGIPGKYKEASVAITLIHNGKEYLIKREERSTRTDTKALEKVQKFNIYEIVDNKAFPVTDMEYDELIQEILPENLSDYFFFWGERIEKLTEKKELSLAVKQFLGLDTIDSAIKHLTNAVNKMTREAGPGTGDAEIQKYQNKILAFENDNKKIQQDIESKQNTINYYDKKAKELYAELTTSENRELQSRQNDYLDKKKQLETVEKQLETAKMKFFKDFNDSKNYVYLFSSEAEKKAAELLNNNPEPVIGWNYIDLNAINEILNRKECICGNKFCEGDSVHKYLLEQKKIVAPNVIGGVINSFVEGIERRETFNRNYSQLIHNDYKSIVSLNDDRLDLSYDVNQLHRLITGKSDMKAKNLQYEQALAKVNEATLALGGLEKQLEKNNENIERCRNNISILMGRNRKYYKQAREIAYGSQVLEMLKKEYSSNVETLKNKLEEYVNQNFQSVYHGNRIIRIDDKYKAVAYNKVGENWITSETSPGLETVKNFAFIAGLVQCAKEKIIGSDGSKTEANSNTYPLVLDAPFSQADEKHVPAISTLIANNAEQIILVVMKKDWNYARKVLNPKVGKYYCLEKVTETRTFLKEGEPND